MGTTRHARKRMRQRAGITESASGKSARHALEYGIRTEETRGRLRGFLRDKEARHRSQMYVYGGKAYAFDGDTAITVLNIPDDVMEDLRLDADPLAYWRAAYSRGKRKATLERYLGGRRVFFMEAPVEFTFEADLGAAAFISAMFSYSPSFRSVTCDGARDPVPRFMGFRDLDEWFKKKVRVPVSKYLYGNATNVMRSARSALLGNAARRSAYYERLFKESVGEADWEGREAVLAEMNKYSTYFPLNRGVLGMMVEICSMAEGRPTVYERTVRDMQKAWETLVSGNLDGKTGGLDAPSAMDQD